ncbi:MAG: NAD(P)-dependent oxidoreductase, partial [Pseudomonadota bacterium]
MAKVAWIGLGVMGYPMAGHVAKKGGHDVTVYNRTAAKAEQWGGEFGCGQTAATPAQAAKEADFVFCCVGNDDDLRAVTLGEEGAFQTQRPGTVFIDHTTASADAARTLHEAAQHKGFAFLDAPVSGGQSGAQNGALTVMCGGAQEAFDTAQPVMAHFAKKTTLMGGPGAGQLTKMVNQLCIAGLVQGLSEGLHFAEKAGLDLGKVLATVSQGAAQSWQMENRWEAMRAGEFN